MHLRDDRQHVKLPGEYRAKASEAELLKFESKVKDECFLHSGEEYASARCCA